MTSTRSIKEKFIVMKYQHKHFTDPEKFPSLNSDENNNNENNNNNNNSNSNNNDSISSFRDIYYEGKIIINIF